MRRRALLMMAVVGSAAAQTSWQETSYAKVGGWVPVSSWCDTPGRVLAVTAPGGSSNAVKLAQWVVGGQSTVQNWQLGRPNPGAGQVYTPLTPAGQVLGPNPRFFIHSSNIENTADPRYRMTHINEYVVPAGRFRCRYVPQATVLAATAKHTAIVWETGGTVTYASRNRDGTPGIQLTGGTHTGAAGRERYVWNNAGYRYVLEVCDSAQPGGSLSVFRGERVLSREELLAYSISVPGKEAQGSSSEVEAK